MPDRRSKSKDFNAKAEQKGRKGKTRPQLLTKKTNQHDGDLYILIDFAVLKAFQGFPLRPHILGDKGMLSKFLKKSLTLFPTLNRIPRWS